MFKTVDVNNVWLWVVESWGYDGKYNEELLYGKEQNRTMEVLRCFTSP